MALYADITFDSRVQREARSLAEAGHEVTVYCLAGSVPTGEPFKVVTHMPRSSSELPGRSSRIHAAARESAPRRVYDKARWVVGYLRNLRAWGSWVTAHAAGTDVWHAHDLPGLMAVGPHVRDATSLIYDSHEIFVEAGSALRFPGFVRRWLQWYERHLTRRATALITVNEGYAEVLQERLAPRRTILVRNCPPRHEPIPRDESPLRGRIGVGEDTEVILYHGVFGASRGLEHMARSLKSPGMGATHGVALGFGDREGLDALAREPGLQGRLHVLDAVPPSELLAWVAGADVDVMPLQPTTLNHYLCSPNKLWESVAAGVPVVTSDFPVMRRVVLDPEVGPLGTVCDPVDPDSIARAVREVLDRPAADQAELRARCLRASHEKWNWETESARLIGLYAALGGLRASAWDPTTT
jgi:glycosyltransferase involved in cell wall biosynthesis